MDIFHVFIFDIFFNICFTFDRAYGIQLLELKVPPLADPRDNLTLGCRFDMGSDELNSVKWYKDDNEFFRYTPHSQPHVRSFPVAGVLIAGGVAEGSDCDSTQCTVHLTQLTATHSRGSYRCEVSSEAPTFHVAFGAANLTVAAIGREDPHVLGVLDEYDLGDVFFANCTSAPADPVPHLDWIINGRPAPRIAVGQLRSSRPDALGLATRSVILRFYVEKRHFPAPRGVMELRCVATTLGIPTPPRNTTVRVRLRNHQASNQMFAWQNNAGTTVI